MKKTLVALAVAAVAATSANAAVVYNQDGTKVDVGGSVRLLLSKAKEDRVVGKAAEHKRLDLLNKASRLEVKVSHDLGEGLSALGYGRLNLGNEDFADDKVDFDNEESKHSVALAKLYAGFSLDGVGAFTLGRQDTNGDDVGLSDYTYNLGGINRIVTNGDKVARFTSAEFHGLKLGLDYVFGGANKDDKNTRAYVLSAFYDRSFGDVGFAFHAGYSNKKLNNEVNGKQTSQKAFTLATELSYGPVSFAVDYSQAKSSNSNNQIKWNDLKFVDTSDNKVKYIKFKKVRDLELGLKYQVTEKSKVYTVVNFGKSTLVDTPNKDIEVKSRGYIFGADYKIHPQVVTYVEGGKFRFKDNKGRSSKDHQVNLGLRVFF